ncbi:uncharacterized protein BX664DRAFT_384967 [Halteromyces radiatus]|uniref:uncharacterized protein n=1 Tax=Halteromyces radiatus TaxID=101107 RepID=UPI00221FEBD6|nr:uncharacterized protein BX664DRAFT_384967 [Halteromyces radiatus]KAI8093554.1 hypothetical protein BX664DRAFT_384967 [Halteromyces radiatus]
MRCHNCGSGRVETDPSTGTTFCIACGGVLEENNIVAEVTFSESAGGKTVLQGAFAGESGRISSGGPFGHGRGKEGQEQAIDNGRQRIGRLAHGLRLPERFREAAQRYYNLAVVNRFTRGRRSDHVAAVCLYIVCRNEQSSQMLIDFSDLLQTNVFVLGSTFLKLVRTLNLKLPLIDPSIYISRFAAACDFGDYTHRVAQDAVRLTQRMDRDWIRTGRRPAGICGACLLIAARLNGFKRSIKEMIFVVKVAEQTIQKRLKEFGDTESATLSVRDFRDIWIETEADPPAFTKNRKNQKQETENEENNSDTQTTHNKDLTDTSSTLVTVTKISPSSPEHNELSTTVSVRKASITIKTEHEQPENDNDENNDLEGATLVESQNLELSQQPDTEPSNTDNEATQVNELTQDMVNPELDEQSKLLQSEMEEFMDKAVKASETLGDKNVSEDEDEEETSLSDVDDEEIEAVLLNPEEVELKTTIWYNANKEYLAEMEAKARKIEMDKKNGVYTRKAKGKRKRLPTAATPAEAAKQLLNTRKISRKINQAVFDDMFESPETIARIKAMDQRKQSLTNGTMDQEREVVEESGEAPVPKKKKKLDENGNPVDLGPEEEEEEHEHEDEEDDEDMDLDDMAEDEVLMRRAREQMGYQIGMEVSNEDYYDYDEHDY